jgi:Transglutaminase-like superfamily
VLRAAGRLLRRPPTIADARAAWWTWRTLRAARAQLRGGVVREIRLAPPPPVAGSAARAVRVVLASQRPSCLERSLVLQRWLAGQGIHRDVVVGTEGSAPSDFAAHAWLDGEPQPPERHYVELLRLSP